MYILQLDQLHIEIEYRDIEYWTFLHFVIKPILILLDKLLVNYILKKMVHIWTKFIQSFDHFDY